MSLQKQFARVLIISSLLLAAGPALAATGSGGHLSTNWAGYTATHEDFGGVGATWKVSPLTATSTLMTDVTWVGIGGTRSKDLVQAGTQAAVQGRTIQYWAWYELLPAYQQPIPVTIHGGDKVSVSISEIVENLWLISFTNVTTGESFYKAVEYNSARSSAEWIQEMPVVFNKDNERTYAPLSEFGSVTFSNAYAIVDGKHIPADQLRLSASTMVSGTNKRVTLAEPSEVKDGSFTVVRSQAVPSPATSRHNKPWDILWSLPKK